jgi:hypothetical protein
MTTKDLQQTVSSTSKIFTYLARMLIMARSEALSVVAGAPLQPTLHASPAALMLAGPRTGYDGPAVLTVGNEIDPATSSLPSNGADGQHASVPLTSHKYTSPSIPWEPIPQAASQTLFARTDQSTNLMLERPAPPLEYANGWRHTRRPTVPKLLCPNCDDDQDGFRGLHELERHMLRAHFKLRKVWICVESSEGDGKLLADCKACRT